ncbi:MAG: hypothetical protein Q7S26_01130 [bacterium]|nr:hypothetical protein [bacterium]
MRRRELLLSLTALVACPSLALAAQRPRRKEAAKHFDWTHPGVRPYTGSDEQAFASLASGGLIPPHVLAPLQDAVRNNAGYQDTIPDGYRFTRMLFGSGSRVNNVVAHTAQWPAEATRAIVRYEYRLHEKVYVLLRPSVCGNWALRILNIQGVCIACVDCAQDDREEIKREQAALQRRRGRKKRH